MALRYWMGSEVTECDLCEKKITDEFVDGNVRGLSWACMCPQCHASRGGGLGTGRGQRYERQDDGRWLKTGG